MSTFDYLTPGEAVTAARADAPDYQRIIGLQGVDADRIPNLISRTKAGYAHKPEEPWRAHGHSDKFKVIERVEWAKDADPGTAEVFYADGNIDLIKREDLLCVERPIIPTEADRNAAERAMKEAGDAQLGALAEKWSAAVDADTDRSQTARLTAEADKPKEYVIQGNYGSGWEDVNTETTPEDGQRSLAEYRENEPQYAHRMRIRTASN